MKVTDSIPDNLTINDFEYHLPNELIAQEPVVCRENSRLMILNRSKETFEHSIFKNISQYLQAGDVLVLNDTKVIPAKIICSRMSGGLVELLLLKPEARQPGFWQCMASPLRKLKKQEVLVVKQSSDKQISFTIADFCESPDGQKRVLVDFGTQENIYNLLHIIGQAPLPPYIHHNNSRQEMNLDRYQTVFAKHPGAVAAPTAGLHFTEQLLNELIKKNIDVNYLTLHVGPGTFKPVTGNLDDHKIEEEEFFISDELAIKINTAKQEGRRIIAVGTTACRALETAGSTEQIKVMSDTRSSLYIKPGYKFNIVDGLITNFHLSRSSLLILVSAFAGHSLIMSAYNEAIFHRYRFYSYGDAMLII